MIKEILDKLPSGRFNNSRAIVREYYRKFKASPCDRTYRKLEQLIGVGDWNTYDVCCDPPENYNH